MTSTEPTRILLIEDNQDDHMAVERLLRRIGGDNYQLIWKDNWDDGLQALLAGNFDVGLLDYRLADRRGLDLIRRAHANGCRRPLILLTGDADPTVDRKAIRAGAADYLLKDRLDANTLERSIRHSLDRQRVLDALAQAQNDLECKVAERTAALTKANQELAAANRRKNEFIAMLGHELRNPLTPVASGLDLLAEDQLPAAQREAACRTMRKHLDHLRHIVDDLLDVARLSHGKINASRDPLDLNALVKDIVEETRGKLLDANRTFHAEQPAGEIWIDGDADLLIQVFRNLVQNAVKFTDEGDVIRFIVRAGEQHVSVRVEDTGIGIARDQLPSLFEPFSQADRSLDRSKGGLGLGLAFASGVTKQHDGEITAESDGVGQGAAFSVRLPLSKSPPCPEHAPAPPESTDRPPLLPPEPTMPKRILVIEDHADAAEMIKTLLTYRGYDVTVAVTGPAGLHLAETTCPDVVLCDIGLPTMDGYQIVETLRGRPDTADLFIVAISGYGHPEALARSQQAGFDEHLVKPLDMDRLQELLDSRCQMAGDQC